MLISAGFHGEEAAGPWGMLHFLSELQQDIFERINLSLLPLVNPTGFAKGHRFNKFGENPNRGFLQPKEGEAVHLRLKASCCWNMANCCRAPAAKAY